MRFLAPFVSLAASLKVTPCSSRRTAASWNSLVNKLPDNPLTKFFSVWILSLTCLCQNGGEYTQGLELLDHANDEETDAARHPVVSVWAIDRFQTVSNLSETDNGTRHSYSAGRNLFMNEPQEMRSRRRQ